MKQTEATAYILLCLEKQSKLVSLSYTFFHHIYLMTSFV